VPIDLLKPLLSDLVTHGKSPARPRPWIGVQTQEVHGNVIVTRVSPDGPADAAAMRPGDVIVTLGGVRVTSQSDFYTRLWSRGTPGVEVPLEVLRAGKIQSVTVTSGNRDSYYRAKPTY
jgi:S1-C subfamily serine protease